MDGDLDSAYENIQTIVMELETKEAAKKKVSKSQDRKNDVKNSLDI